MASGKNSIRKAKKRKQKASTSGTTWVNKDNKIIQADEGRNKKRLLKEKVGQDISKVRARQKSRSDLKKTAEVAGSGAKRALLSIKNAFTPKKRTTRRKKY